MSNKTEKMLKFIDQFYKYYYDSDDGNSIVDGGNDMYDNGNIVNDQNCSTKYFLN